MKQLYIANGDKFVRSEEYLALIKNQFDLDSISIGNLIHEHIVSDTELGLELNKELNSGNQISLPLLEKVILPEIQKLNSPFLIGYPRTQAQLNSLKNLLLNENIILKAFFYLKNGKAINFGHLEIDESEMTILNMTEPEIINKADFKSLLKSFA